MNKTTKTILVILLFVLILGAIAVIVKLDSGESSSGTSGGTSSSGTGQQTSGYTAADLENAYQEGYDQALEDHDTYVAQISALQSTITTKTGTITQLTAEKAELAEQVTSLTNQVTTLTSQKNTLQAQVDLLSESADTNAATIDTLNAQIVTLNSQIASLTEQITNKNTSIANANTQIAELQRTIAFYEEFVGQFETDDQALVRFMVDGSVYDCKVVNIGDHVTTTTPENTDYFIFNGWTVDGETINLSTYVVEESVIITADVTHKYIVNFNVGTTVKSTVVVEQGDYATKPSTNPKKTGYTFKYWTLDGENEVDVSQYPITANTTFYAKFVELYTVTFEKDGEIIATRRIERGSKTNNINVEDTEDRGFNGWTVNGSVVDVTHYIIYEDTNFVADMRDLYTVTFIVEYIADMSKHTQTVATKKVMAGKTTSVTNPVIADYTFNGWTVSGSSGLVNLNSYYISMDTTFVASMTSVHANETFTVTFYKFGGTQVHATQTVRWGEHPTMPSTNPTYLTSYHFFGWCTSPVGLNTIPYMPALSEFYITGNLSFYPVFLSNGGGTITV